VLACEFPHELRSDLAIRLEIAFAPGEDDARKALQFAEPAGEAAERFHRRDVGGEDRADRVAEALMARGVPDLEADGAGAARGRPLGLADAVGESVLNASADRK
jgi:hypothetical protein